MTAFIIVLLYLAGFFFTLRHCVYYTRVVNEDRYWMEQLIGPRLMSKNDYRQMHLELLDKLRSTSDGRKRIKNHDSGDLAFRLDPYSQATKYPSDYADVFLHALLFPFYWLRVLILGIGYALTGSSKPTPGELRQERERLEWERKWQKMKTQHLYEETERLRREQDGD